MSDTKLFLTSMSSGESEENAVAIIEPILDYLDAVIWVLHDTPVNSPIARYLESVKKGGKIIHRSWPSGRHWHSMNDTLFTGLMEDDSSLCIWTDPLEIPRKPFVSRIKSELDPLMRESESSVLYFYGKPYLFRYYETLQYHQSPHWTLGGYPGRAVEWSQIEPNEDLVRKNMRPIKRKDPFHFVSHFLRYFLEYPAGSNSAALGLDHFPGGSTQENFVKREKLRLEFRREMKKRGFPLTVEGFITMCQGPLDSVLKNYLNSEKTFADAYWHLVVKDSSKVKNSHNPSDAFKIE